MTDLSSRSLFLSFMLEMLFYPYWGTVGYYDGQSSRIVAEDLSMPNGITQSLDGRYIYAYIYSQ